MSKNPSLQHIHVFFCEAYVHVLEKKSSKLDNNVVRYIFIICGVVVKGYKISCPVDGKDFYTRNVNFREAKPSPILVELKEDDKKKIVQLPPDREI